MSAGYEFSSVYHAHHLSFSPGTTFLATTYHNRLIIRSSSTLNIIRTFQCLLPSSPLPSSSKSTSNQDFIVDSIQWSSDSLYILAYSSSAKAAWIFGLTEDGNGEGGEMARLGGEVEGLIRVEWGSGGREVLAWSDFGLRLTVYDLTTGQASFIQNPKSHLNCHTFSPDGRYIAIAERHAGKDYIGVYEVSAGYALLRHFALQTFDVQQICWSPCGRYIAAVDSELHYSLHIHLPIGTHLTHFSPSASTFSPSSTSEDPGLGIRTIAWAPGGRWIAIGGWDGKVRIVESEGWRCIATMAWGGKTSDAGVTVWKEPSGWLRETGGRGLVQFDQFSYPVSLPQTRPDTTKPHPPTGISHISFDPEATLLLIRLENQPNIIHIHSFLPEPTSLNPVIRHLSSVKFTSPVKSAKWGPKRRRVGIVTRGGKGVYIWDGEVCWVEEGETGREEARGGMMEGIGIPSSNPFSSYDLTFAPDGNLSLAIQDKDQFVMLYDTEGAEPSRRWDLEHTEEEREEGEGLTRVEEGDEESFMGLEGGRIGVLV